MSKGKILIIDDDQDIVRIVKLRLELDGYTADSRENGQLGLEAVRTLKPDAVVLDIRMPGIDGIEVLRRIKNDPDSQHIPVVILSANALGVRKLEALDLGAAYFIEKPYEAKVLLQALESALATRPDPSELCE